MGKYVEQYDLPCYPHAEPLPNCRTICGIEDLRVRATRHLVGTEDERGPFQMWSGGSGVGRAPTLEAARAGLHARVAASLDQQIKDAEARAAYYRSLRARWGEGERQMMRFEVSPPGAA